MRWKNLVQNRFIGVIMVEFKLGKLPDDKKERLAYLIRLDRKLQEYHNEMGKKFRDGLITEEKWKYFVEVWYFERDNLIQTKLTGCRNELRADNEISAEISDIED